MECDHQRTRLHVSVGLGHVEREAAPATRLVARRLEDPDPHTLGRVGIEVLETVVEGRLDEVAPQRRKRVAERIEGPLSLTAPAHGIEDARHRPRRRGCIQKGAEGLLGALGGTAQVIVELREPVGDLDGTQRSQSFTQAGLKRSEVLSEAG
jgi:hypothetical protein